MEYANKNKDELIQELEDLREKLRLFESIGPVYRQAE